MSATLIYKMDCGCEFWEGLDINGEVYPQIDYCGRHISPWLAELRALNEPMSCGHLRRYLISADEGTIYCMECAWEGEIKRNKILHKEENLGSDLEDGYREVGR